jgi:class 3 adenylate cyclase/tetratricopeptide (TPR) repeat protein
MAEREQLEQAIAQLEAQRATLGDAVVDASTAALHEKLAALERTPKQRKLATILFADVLGYTAMSETMDAEEVSEVMNALWQRIDAAIVEHGGHIDKHTGDGVMAVWGVGAASECDPEHAIRAALAMQAALAEYKAGHDIHLRVGLSTGPVLLGTVGTTGEFSVIGDTVNLASRLEGAAPAGGVLISFDTYRHVRGMFDVVEQKPIQVKGKARPVQTYLVQHARPRAFRTLRRAVAGVETRMVGRDPELLMLQNMFRDAAEDAEVHVVTVVGDAGVGKSRLLYEFDKWIQLLPEQVGRFEGRATPETEGRPYGLIRRMFAHRFEILESDRAATVRDKFRTGMAAALNSEQADLVGQLIGLDFSTSQAVRAHLGSESFREMVTAYLAKYLRVVSSEPTVIFLEDIHWADDSSLDLLDDLVTVIRDSRLLVVCLARQPLFERRPSWGEGQLIHTRINLRPLSRRASRALVGEILQKTGGVPDELRDLIVEGAEGNPFYVEELIRVLIEDGVIVRGKDHWRVELGQLAGVHVPPTLTGVLQARLDSLPLEEKELLQRASVVGRLFWDTAVAELKAREGSELDWEELASLLEAVRDRELILRRERSTFAGAEEYVFKHALLRDVTYETVLLNLRRVYHGQVARWLEVAAGERIGEYLGLIGGHYELAGETEKAVGYFLRAGNQARLAYANQEARAFFTQALALTADPTQRFQLLLEREKTCNLLGDRAQQEADLRELLELAETSQDDAKRARVHYRIAFWLEARGDYPAVHKSLQRGLAAARRAGDAHLEAANLHLMASVAWRQGRLAAALEAAREALEVARASGDAEHEATSLTTIGIVQRSLGELDLAGASYRQARDIRRAIGNRRGEAISLNQLGNVLSDLGEYTEALDHFHEALDLFRLVGDRRGEAWSLRSQGTTYLQCGEYEMAHERFEKALSLRRAVGDRRGEGVALSDLGHALLEMGRREAAWTLLEQGEALLRDIGARRDQVYALTYLARAMEQRGDWDDAETAHQSALSLRRELGQASSSMENVSGLARVALERGDLEVARTHVKEMMAHLRAHGLVPGEPPFRDYQTAFRVFQACGSKLAARRVLREARQALMDRAERITDPVLRCSFLERVPEHTEILAAWREEEERQ